MIGLQAKMTAHTWKPVDRTFETYESAFTELKPGTLVSMAVNFYGDPLSLDTPNNPYNIFLGQHLLYLGILDTCDVEYAIEFRDLNGPDAMIADFDYKHAWLNGETVIYVNDFRAVGNRETGDELDAVTIIKEPPSE